MFERLSALLGLKKDKPDAALAARFARMRRQYEGDPSQGARSEVLGVMRTGMNMRTVTGAQKSTTQELNKGFIDSYARANDREPALK